MFDPLEGLCIVHHATAASMSRKEGFIVDHRIRKKFRGTSVDLVKKGFQNRLMLLIFASERDGLIKPASLLSAVVSRSAD
jgi:hypothetical protein